MITSALLPQAEEARVVRIVVQVVRHTWARIARLRTGDGGREQDLNSRLMDAIAWTGAQR